MGYVSHRSVMMTLLLAALGLSSQLFAQYSLSSDASLIAAWRREFQVQAGKTVVAHYAFPTSAEAPAILIHGPQWRLTVGTAQAEGETPNTAPSLSTWLTGLPTPVRYVELANVDLQLLKHIPEAVRAGVTHVNLRVGDHATPADLQVIRATFPGLRGLALSLAHLETYLGPGTSREQIEAGDPFIVELSRFENLEDLALSGVGSSTANRHGRILAWWLASLHSLRRLELFGCDLRFWTTEITAGKSVQWLHLGACENYNSEVLWKSILHLKSLRCLGLSATSDSEPPSPIYDPTQVRALKELKHLESLSLGQPVGDSVELCQAISELPNLAHLRVPTIRHGIECHELKALAALKGLRTLDLPLLNVYTLPFVLSQSGLQALTTRLDGSPWNKSDAVVAALAKLENLAVLDLHLNLPLETALAGEYALSVKHLRLTGAVAPEDMGGVATLVKSCPNVEVLELGFEPVPQEAGEAFRADVKLPAQVRNAVSGKKKLRVLAAKLPQPRELAPLLATLPELAVICDFTWDDDWATEMPAALAEAKALRVVIRLRMSHESAIRLVRQLKAVRVLRAYP